MPINNQPLDVRGFSGGLADEELSVTPQHYTRADNLLLTPQYDLKTRPGSVCFDVAHAQLPSGQQRVNGLINYDQDANLLAISGNHAYVYTGGNWTEITGAAGDALHTGTNTAALSTAEWKKHIFLASSEQIAPVKLYKDNGGTFRAITAGLPFMATPVNYNPATALAAAIVLANDLRTHFLTHFASTHMHKIADPISQGILSAAACVDLPTLLALTAQMQKAYQNHFNDYVGVGLYHTKEQAQTYTSPGDQTLETTLAPTTLDEVAPILNNMVTALISHIGKSDIHLGNADPANMPTSPFLNGVTSGPYVDLDRTLFYTVVTKLKHLIGQHLLDGGAAAGHSAHKVADTTNFNDLNINAPGAATDEYNTPLLLAFIEGDYYAHEVDAAMVTPSIHRNHEAASHQLPYFAPNGYTSYSYGPADYLNGLAPGNWVKMAQRINTLTTNVMSHINEATNPTTVAHLAGSDYYVQDGPNTWTPSYSFGALDGLSLGTYTYAFTYEYTYTTTTGVEFKMEGPPLLVEALNVFKPEVEGLLIQGITALANSGSTNYDVSNVKINIYRTVNGGQTLFFVDQIANGTTSYTDFTTDDILQTRTQIYTAGGVSDNEPAPPAKYVHITEDDFGYWGNIIDPTGVPRPNRICQSIAGSPDSVPSDYFVDLPYPNTGISSIKGVRVAWTKKGTYRLEGSIDEQGNGSITAVAISDSVGCVGGFGVVPTDQGLIFPGSDGFYVTNGYQVSKLSRDWRTTYLNLIRSDTVAQMIYGALDKKKKRVWFTTSSTGAENDSCYILDLNLTLNENGPWTTASNRSYFAPSAIAVFNDQVIRGDSRGYVLMHQDSTFSDPKIDTSIAASQWHITSIFPDYRSPDNDFGSIMLRKYVPKIVVKAKNLGNMSLQINSINDGGKNIAALAPIRYRGGPTFGDPSIVTVGGGPSVSGGGLPEYKRHFPAGSMRCSTKRVQFILAKVAITESDALGLGALNQGTKVLTVAGATFPDYSDHVLALDNDGYVREYTIASNTATTLTVLDPGGHLPASANYKWVIRGYPKDEQWQITNYLVYFNLLGTTQLFAADQTGENG